MQDDSDDQRRRRNPVNLLRYQEQQESSSTRQQRTKAKITVNEVRPNIVKRADVGAEIMCLRLAAGQMTRNEWQAFIALREGVLFDPLRPGATARTWFVVPPPAKTASVEVCGKHYGLTPATVERYDRSARRLLNTIRARAGLTGDVPRVPIWPAINSDAALLAYLFSRPE